MKKIFFKITIIALMLPAFLTDCFADQRNFDINQKLLIAMKAYRVPVVGYAIIENYKVTSSETLSIDPGLKVSNNSLFQAASISKSVSAYGALKLVSKHKLSLDESVNDRLTAWKIPLNEYNIIKVRFLLDMTSGLSVSGFPGHEQGKPLPTLQQVLNGQSPANTPPIKVFYKPGPVYFYSGGAYEVLEQMMQEVKNHSHPG